MTPLQLITMLAVEFQDVIFLAVGIFLSAMVGLSGLVSSLLIAGRAFPKI
jgi:hypothetical protein